MRALLQIMQREFAVHLARRTEWLSSILFYIICTSLFPIALGSWPVEQIWLAPVILWLSALIAIMLAQESLLREDFRLGIFDLLCMHEINLSILVFIKIITHWFLYSCPLVLITPILGISFGMGFNAIVVITISLLIGTLALSFIAAIGAAITVPLARGGAFVALLILPLYIPVLCLGSNIGMLGCDGIMSYPHIALLLALTIIVVIIVPPLVARAIVVSME